MAHHSFIFSSGLWLGEGKLQLNMLEEELFFFSRWKIEEKDSSGCIECVQEIQVKGVADIMINQFTLSSITASGFSIVMDNHAVGKVIGTGICSEDMIGWEFRVPKLVFEGFEFYEKESDDLYRVHGEFSTTDGLRTAVHGKIWRSQKNLFA